MKKIIPLMCLVVGTLCPVYSQPVGYTADSLFRTAQVAAFSNDRLTARNILASLLEDFPNHHDAHLLMARTYAWDNDYTAAYQALEPVLAARPEDEEGLALLADLSFWQQNYQQALVALDKALVSATEPAGLLFRKAQTYTALERYNEAAKLLDEVRQRFPGYDPTTTRALANALQEKRLTWEATSVTGVDIFSSIFDPAYYASLQVANRRKKGTSLMRLNYATRFGKHGWQPEWEWYPSLSKRTYAYLNYGFSQSVLFPRHRIGAEMYTVVLRHGEASIGMRHLMFGATNRVWTLTGSCGHYGKNYWISFRPSLTASYSTLTGGLQLSLRRYLGGKKDYLGMQLGTGLFPDERRLQSGVGFNVDGTLALRAKAASVVWNKSLTPRYQIRMAYEFTHREIGFDDTAFVRVHSLQLALAGRF